MVLQGLIDSTKSYATFEKQDELAFHGFAFFIRGLTPNLKFIFLFATRDDQGCSRSSTFTNILGSSFYFEKKKLATCG